VVLFFQENLEKINNMPNTTNPVVVLEAFRKGGSKKKKKKTKSKKDSCYYAAKRAHKVFPSAYASGMIAKCRKRKAGKRKKKK